MAFPGQPTPNPVYPANGRILWAGSGANTILQAQAGQDITSPVSTCTGQYTTGVPVGNQHQLNVNFGPGAGNWVLGDLPFVRIDVRDDIGGAAGIGAQGGIGQLSDFFVTAVIIAANLVVTIGNRGARATGNCVHSFHYMR